jgi:predicted ester cyclase
MGMTVDEAKSFCEKLSGRFNAGDQKAYDELWTNRYVGHGSSENFGLEDVKKAHAAWRKSFSDIRVKLDIICVAGDLIASRIGFSGTHDGVFMGKAPTRKHFEVWGVDVCRIEGGKIAEEWFGFDELRRLQQLGIAPKLE